VNEISSRLFAGIDATWEPRLPQLQETTPVISQVQRWFMSHRIFPSFDPEMETSEGQGLVEYALIILLVALVAISSLAAFGNGANGLYGSISARLPFH
jgi:Flp pilus assembly pilin Flp